MGSPRQFSAEIDSEVLDALQQIADWEGREFQAVLEEALRVHLERMRRQTLRSHVLGAFRESVRERDELYRALAK